MKHIFISHAAADADLATRLATDLKNAGHETKVDTIELKLGRDSIDYMNQGIADAHTVIILYSKHTQNADWQKLEINSALWNEIAQSGGSCIVLRLDDTEIPPVLGPKVYGSLNPLDENSYHKCLEDICDAILSEKTASSVVSEAFRTDSSNPFRRVRAEYFEEEPNLLAKMFAPPDAVKIGALEEMKPCFLEGSRGTGKSMLLLSLRARNFLSRHKTDRSPSAFGFYLKLNRGAICNAGVLSEENNDPNVIIGPDRLYSIQVTDIASQEIVVCLLESLLSEMDYCVNNNLLSVDRVTEKNLIGMLSSVLSIGQTIRSIGELLEILANMHQQIANFIRRRFIYDEQIAVPIATFDLEMLKRIIKAIKNTVPGLANAMFVALLDEYENLFPYQQKVVNGFIKLAAPHFSVKVAKKVGSGDTSATMTGQELQETHDYTRLSLIYDVEDDDQHKAYLALLKSIVTRSIQSQGLGNVDVVDLLPKASNDEIEGQKMQTEVARLCKVTLEEFKSWPEEKQKQKMTYYGEAAIYRNLYGFKGRQKDKLFAGFGELALISSGVIRYFQEILGVAYHLTYGSDRPPPGAVSFPAEKQSKAVHLVSEHNLTTLSRNVEKHGESLKYFLLDLGDCLRDKLLHHSSEPEAARLTITDPELLEQPVSARLKRILEVGVREGVFQTKEGRPAFKPKHRADPQPTEFNICRIFAPVLQISPRLRWRTPVECKALIGLVSPDKRYQAVQQLKKQFARSNLNETTKNNWFN